MVILIILILMVGCQKQTFETGADVDNQHTEINIKDESMDGKIEVDVIESDSWCKAGSQWKFAGATDQGAQTGSWKILELVKTGKYAGLCHIIWEAQNIEGSTKMEYYFSENGENGYYEIDVNGQKIAQEWHK